jgi:hypothetical protein
MDLKPQAGQRPRSRRMPTFLWMCLVGFIGCASHSSEDDLDVERRPSRSASIRVTKQFLDLAARGDSAALTEIANDSVIRLVLRNHRAGATEEHVGAAETIRRARVTRYAGGSEVMFRYGVRDIASNGYVRLVVEGGELRVAKLGLGVKID